MQTVLSRARERAEADERATVAAAIQEAIERSGLSQAEFASRIGTSPSRLSTYATGKVTPSAALMIRISRVADQESAHLDRTPNRARRVPPLRLARGAHERPVLHGRPGHVHLPRQMACPRGAMPLT